MPQPIIQVENLSKKFIIGHQKTERYTALRDVIANNIKGAIRRTRELVAGNYVTEGDTEEEFWALKDLNFSINVGDRVGVIGRNGAGKSTLLKVLSRITEPTSGKITIKGRVASLLEVGTGFHPELTGRENVFLNGAILGMSRNEIRRKFDEIVAFAEVEKFLDTPVKRYSSGMYVRLAFSVAAHLEPEVLIVDEVLAVGDAQFQKKCLGKMEEVSRDNGRTLLFVSHNIEAVMKLCTRGIYLKNGKLSNVGDVAEVVNAYLKSDKEQANVLDLDVVKRSGAVQLRDNARFKSVQLVSKNPWKVHYKEPISFEFEIEIRSDLEFFEIGVSLFNNFDVEIASSLSSDHQKLYNVKKKSVYKATFSYEDFHLLPNTYKVSLGIRSENGFEDYIYQAFEFEVLMSEISADDNTTSRQGIIIPRISFELA